MIDSCNLGENKELICIIKRTNIEEILAYDREEFTLGVLYKNYGSYYYTNTILNIKFNYPDITKENIYINITKLKDDISEKNHLIAYKTNVSDINNVISETFKLTFNINSQPLCFFKKSENTNLLILCRFVYEGKYSLKNTQKETILDDINIKYNFIISPINNDEKFTITNESNIFIFNSYPKILDFISHDTIEISFLLPTNNLNLELKLSTNNDKLKCDNLLGILNCIVPLSHFDNEENGYYNLYYNNPRGNLSVYHEVTPFKVILPERIRIKKEDNIGTIPIGPKGILYFITDFIDIKNIFDSDIEETVKLDTIILDEENNNYEVNCRLFNPSGEKLIIICNLNENLKKEIQDITLSTIRFNYKEYNIIILSETSVFRVIQLNYSIPFIYSDKQNIIMSEGINSYELKFKFDSYNEDLLFI